MGWILALMSFSSSQTPPTAVMDQTKPVTVVSFAVLVEKLHRDCFVGCFLIQFCVLGLLLLTVDRLPVGFMIPAHQNTPALSDLRGLSASSDDDLMLMACKLPAPADSPLRPQLLPPQPNEPWGFGSFQSGFSQLPATGKLAGCLPTSCHFELPPQLTLLGCGTDSPLLRFLLCFLLLFESGFSLPGCCKGLRLLRSCHLGKRKLKLNFRDSLL